jgi:CRISPR/Cas system type I-B associated protein Csh2 (Cas7 group RAMP superfamily)
MARISKLRNLTLSGKIIAAASRSIEKNARTSGQMADSHSVAQTVHAVGGMLDQKAARLVTLARDDHMFTVEYLSASGKKSSTSTASQCYTICRYQAFVERLGGCASVNRGDYSLQVENVFL